MILTFRESLAILEHAAEIEKLAGKGDIASTDVKLHEITQQAQCIKSVILAADPRVRV